MFNRQQQQSPPPPNQGPPQMTPQQIIQSLMRMDPQQRNAVIMKNPQLQVFLQQYEQQRKAALQQQQQQAMSRSQAQGQPPQPQQPQGMHPQPTSIMQLNLQQQQHQPMMAPQSQQMQSQIPMPGAQQQPQQQQHQHQLKKQLPIPQTQAKRPRKRSSVKDPLTPQGPPTKRPTPIMPSATLPPQMGPGVVSPPMRQQNNGPIPQQQMPVQQIPMPMPPNNGLLPQLQQQHQTMPASQQQQPAVNKPPPPPIVPQPEKVSDINFWSKSLRNEGKPVPTSTLVYEQMIDRDLDFIKRKQKEQNRPFDADLIERVMRDVKYYQGVRDSRLKALSLIEANKNTESLWGDGYAGYGNGLTAGAPHVVLPKDRKKHSRLADQYIKPDQFEQQAKKPEELVPIRLEFDIDKDSFKLNDTFLWNINESTCPLERFVAILMEDYKFSPNQTMNMDKILSSIKEQINDYHPMVYPKNDTKITDLRFPIMLDITIGNNQLTDRFDWDLTNPENDPEEFAQILADEMSLPGEFVTAIAHAIREQSQIYIKSLYLIGYRFDGSTITGDELREFLRPALDSSNVIRPRYLLTDYTPLLQEISFDTIERLTKERERESRRKKRGQTRVGRRGGVVLPDLHDLPKTFRTPVPSTVLPGGVNLGPNIDGFFDTPLQVEIPKKQMKALEEFKEQERINLIKRQEEMKLEQIQMMELKKDLLDEGDESDDLEMVGSSKGMTPVVGGSGSKVSYSYDRAGSFIVRIKLK